MPNVIDIVQNVQVPQLIQDEYISCGKPVLDNRGRPLHYTGGFAVVFPFDINGERWAFRCWSADIGGIEQRLLVLSDELTKLRLPFFCDFTYVPHGIVVNGVSYPSTRMKWIDGENIKDYICSHKNSPNQIEKLAKNFLVMCQTLHKNKIAHGDLQHGNILVDKKGKRYLEEQDINNLVPFDQMLLEEKVIFKASSIKAIRDKQEIVLEWIVPFKSQIWLEISEQSGLQRCEKTGHCKVKLHKDTDFILHVQIREGQDFEKKLSVLVFDEADINFVADKYFIYPKIPVVISWEVKNAKKVWFDSEEVAAVGKKVVEPKKATSYVLSAEDEFGKKEQRIDIKMLPVPQVRSLLVPTPNIVNNMAITVLQPKQSVESKIPRIEVDWIKTEVSKVPSLTDLGLNVELSPQLPKFSLKSALKRIFNTNKKK